MGGASLPTQDGCCLDRWIVNIDCARASVPVFRKVETKRYIRHDLLKLIRQRVLQIVAGYEDCNDADTLRSDPMLKTVCDQLPESDPDLATQPTFSRLENSVTKKDLMRLSRGVPFFL